MPPGVYRCATEPFAGLSRLSRLRLVGVHQRREFFDRFTSVGRRDFHPVPRSFSRSHPHSAWRDRAVFYGSQPASMLFSRGLISSSPQLITTSNVRFIRSHLPCEAPPTTRGSSVPFMSSRIGKTTIAWCRPKRRHTRVVPTINQTTRSATRSTRRTTPTAIRSLRKTKATFSRSTP